MATRSRTGTTPGRAAARPGAPTPPGSTAPPRPNPRIQAQTRRVLAQHYRAKYGVK